MYETLMNTVRRFFTPEGFFGLAGGVLSGSRMKAIMLVLFAVAVLALVLWSSAAFRRWYVGLLERGGGRGILAAAAGGLFKLLLVFMVARFLVVAMGYQATVFEHEHGRLTESNRSAVLMKWGSPHEQRELGVTFTKKRTWVRRQLKLPDETDALGHTTEGRIFSEGYWADEAPPVQAVDGTMPTVISTREEQRDVTVEQKCIRRADVEITLRSNPRELGGANYAGYEDQWHMTYLVVNEHEEPVTAHMAFSLPNDRDLFNEFTLTAGGEDVLGRSRTSGGTLSWDVAMEPGEQTPVVISYRSRGLEHLRYIPRRMTPTAHYRVTMNVEGVPSDEADYPIGSMPADENLQALHADTYALHWTLDNALTSYDIGFRLPEARQPQYHIATLLRQAPTGLLLLLALLLAPRFIRAGGRVDVLLLAIISVAYFLFYTFMGRLADLELGVGQVGFVGGFLGSAALMLALVALLRWATRGPAGFMAAQDVAVFGVLTLVYPLAVIDRQSDFWLQALTVAALAYVCVLMVWRATHSGRGQGSGGTAADATSAGA